jgi:hypothetical protein
LGAGVRPEDISELVRDLVRRHTGAPHKQAARSEGQVHPDLISVPEHGAAAESGHADHYHHDNYHGQPAHHHVSQDAVSSQKAHALELQS